MKTLKRTKLALVLVGLCALAGAGWVSAASLSTGTASVCATASTPSHTVAVDGTPVTTIAGATATRCATTTYTIPTVATTATVTVGTATAPAATTATVPAPTTTTAPPSQTFASATSYAAPSFTPTQTVTVTSQSAFMSAWSSLQPGEQIDVQGVTFTGEVVLANKNLSSWAEVHFDPATKFVGVSSATNLPAVWVHDDSHVRFYGGDISDSASGGQAGNGILVYQSSYVSWWGFTIHDTGSTGLAVYPVSGPIDHLDLKGEISKWGLNLAWDPHAEKGTGLHGANLSDASYPLTSSRIALYVHDGAAGAGVEMGSPSAGATGNALYLWCQNLTMQATTQVAGNCLQVWGANVTGNDVKYLEAENLQGRPYDANGMNSGQSLATDTVDYGRASNTNLNPALSSTEPGISPTTRWDTRHGTAFVDVSPTP